MTTIPVADDDGSGVASVPVEELGLRPVRRKRGRGHNATPKATDAVTAEGGLVVGTIDRGDRARIVVEVGEFPVGSGSLRIDCRVWRVTARGGEFRRTTRGVSLAPHELDAAIAALQRARDAIEGVRPGACDAAAGEGGRDGD